MGNYVLEGMTSLGLDAVKVDILGILGSGEDLGNFLFGFHG